MRGIRLFEKILHLPRRIVRELRMVLQLIEFSLVNRFGRARVTEPGGPVVSLTTFGKRSEKVHLAIESIARGAVLPSRLILWIDEESFYRNPPATIRRLQKRGLEVKSCKNYGPHKKYFPFVESQDVIRGALVTADDDVLYPKYWLKMLVEANREYPEAVNCFWAHAIAISEMGILNYRDWSPCDSIVPSYLNLAVGCMGVIYPPKLLMALKRAGTAFESRCPRADDLWLHVQALRSGHRVRQVLPQLPYFSFQSIPGSQQTALSHENVDNDGNDPQVAATYSQADIQLLQAGQSHNAELINEVL